MEFFTEVTITIPADVSDDQVRRLRAAESQQAAELARAGFLIRLWRPDDDDLRWRNIGLWQAADEAELVNVLRTLPLFDWMTIKVRTLAAHPSDPGIRAHE